METSTFYIIFHNLPLVEKQHEENSGIEFIWLNQNKLENVYILYKCIYLWVWKYVSGPPLIFGPSYATDC